MKVYIVTDKRFDKQNDGKVRVSFDILDVFTDADDAIECMSENQCDGHSISIVTRKLLGHEVVPLTEELFLKLGFEKEIDERFPDEYSYMRVSYRSKDKRVVINNQSNSGDGYWYVHIDNEDMSTIGGCDVKYLHEFKQLLRLCRYKLQSEI